jgi:hypothetical protein
VIFREAELSQSLLFIDGADALFRKRTEISDARDWYANIEVNYLLQRIEQYQGLVVLATLASGSGDCSFDRRRRWPVPSIFASLPASSSWPVATSAMSRSTQHSSRRRKAGPRGSSRWIASSK